MYKNLLNFIGKNVLVVGGTGGLGLEISKAFIERGANVCITGRNLNNLEDLVDLSKKNGTELLLIKMDILNADDINSQISLIINKFKHIDILVNSAGINILKPAEEYDDESWEKVINTNLSALHKVTRIVGKHMISKKYGRIINLSSVKSSLGTSENYTAYCASKAGVNMYTKQIACEWAKYNITSNAIAPTFVKTNINTTLLEDKEFHDTLLKRIPLGRLGAKEDIAIAALFLASDEASFITGQILYVDGGLTASQ